MDKRPKKLNKSQIKKLQSLFKKSGVAFAYQFGSTMDHAKTSKLSDYDFAIYFKKDSGNTAKEINLTSSIGQLLKHDKIDLVNLKKAGPLLKYQAVIKGRPIYKADQDENIIYQTRVLREYHDTEHLRNLVFKLQEERIKQGKFGQPGPLEK